MCVRQELVRPLSTSQCITKPSLHRKETEPWAQTKWTEPPVKGKTPTTESLHIYTHARAHPHTHVHTHSLYEQSSCVQRSWERQHCLVHRHHLRNLRHCPAWKHTYTEVTVFTTYLFDGLMWGCFTSARAQPTAVYVTQLESFPEVFVIVTRLIKSLYSLHNFQDSGSPGNTYKHAPYVRQWWHPDKNINHEKPVNTQPSPAPNFLNF